MKGTADEWRAEVGRYCPGNSRLLLSVSCVLAGPVLRLMGEESGGIHLFDVTSSGKTTSAIVGGSVLGGGPDGCINQWRATANGLEGIAAERNDAALLLDELNQVDPRQVNDIIYMLSNGQGKSRANIDGTSRARSDWAVSIVSTGELTLAEHVRQGGGRMRGRSAVRLLDIPADAGAGMGAFEVTYGSSPREFSDLLKANAKRVYGAPFLAWIDGIVTDVPYVTGLLKDLATTFHVNNCPPDASPEVARAVRRFAVIAAAGELATQFGVTGWSECDATWGAKRCLADWIRARGGVGGFDAGKMVSQVRKFLREWGDSDRFPGERGGVSISPAAQEKRRTYKAPAGFRKDGSFYIFPDVFKEEVCAGYSHEAVCHALQDAGFLDFTPGRLTKQTDVGSKKGGRYNAVKESILHDDADSNR